MKMTIGQLARAAGVHVETVRYYQRNSLWGRPGLFFGAISSIGRS